MTQTDQSESAASSAPTPDASATEQGQHFELDASNATAEIVHNAFDYRGDVTLTLQNGEQLQGYVYDRRLEQDPPLLRLMLTAGGKRDVAITDVSALEFSGKDTAAGKSWESWLKRFLEKKASENAPADS